MKRLLVQVAGLSFVAGSLLAQGNTSAGAAANFAWGQDLLTSDDGATSQFWYVGSVSGGRSYCVESGQAANTAIPDKNVDTVLTVFDHDHTTVIATNDDADANEPVVHGFSRVCWIPAAGRTFHYIRVSAVNGSPAATISLRFVDSTLFCPWFFIAGDYNAFSLIRNTSVNPLAGVKVTWWGLNGAVAGSTTVTIPGNGTVILNARDFVNQGIFSNGSVTIAHAGSPQQMAASTTTLSGTTGLGFDALFSQRKRW